MRSGNVAAVRLEAGAWRESFGRGVVHPGGSSEAERLLRKEVAAQVVDAVGLRPGTVVVLPSGALSQTLSGKLRRAALRDCIAE